MFGCAIIFGSLHPWLAMLGILLFIQSRQWPLVAGIVYGFCNTLHPDWTGLPYVTANIFAAEYRNSIQSLSEPSRTWMQMAFLGQIPWNNHQLMNDFKDAGVFHLVVVSGFHISFLAECTTLLLSLPFRICAVFGILREPQRRRLDHLVSVCCFLVLLQFFVTVGAQYPVQRALICWTLKNLSKEFRIPEKTSIAFSIHLFLFPDAYQSLSFWLSWFAYVISQFGNWAVQSVAFYVFQLVFFGLANPYLVIVNLIVSPVYTFVFFATLVFWILGAPAPLEALVLEFYCFFDAIRIFRTEVAGIFFSVMLGNYLLLYFPARIEFENMWFSYLRKLKRTKSIYPERKQNEP